MGYLTPNTLPSEYVSRRVRIPNDPLIIAAVNGAISELSKTYNWEQFGTITPDEIAPAMLDLYIDYEESTGMSFVGMIFPYVSTTAPTNCLFCDGATYLKADYPELATVLTGTALDLNATQFKVPDFSTSSRFPRATPTHANIGNNGGNGQVTLAVGNLPAHSHSVAGFGAAVFTPAGAVPVTIPGLPTVTGNTGAATPFSIIPLNVMCAFMIVAQ